MDNSELLAAMRKRVPPTAVMLGMELLDLDAEAGTCAMRFFVKPEFCNPMGNLQGGLLAAMLDDAAAFAVIAKSGKRIAVPTIEFKVSFFGPGRVNTWAHVAGRCIKLGRTIAFAEADMTDENGRLLARMNTSMMPTEMPGQPMLVESGA
jgi:uncharacterized protein (TIGR00369 family)